MYFFILLQYPIASLGITVVTKAFQYPIVYYKVKVPVPLHTDYYVFHLLWGQKLITSATAFKYDTSQKSVDITVDSWPCAFYTQRTMSSFIHYYHLPEHRRKIQKFLIKQNKEKYILFSQIQGTIIMPRVHS